MQLGSADFKIDTATGVMQLGSTGFQIDTTTGVMQLGSSSFLIDTVKNQFLIIDPATGICQVLISAADGVLVSKPGIDARTLVS
jgi:hypothetical protein